jgi:hypothetical protein
MIKTPYTKLIAASLLAVMSITMMVTATYAWYSLAGSPALTGVQINVGGDNTIMIAPDLQMVTEEGNIVHYPGAFEKNMNITQEKTYEYLNDLAGLSPVSTADGIHWFIPENDENGNPKISSLDDFIMDTKLEYANQTESGGGYAYVDFWIVSPMDNCTLRISIGDEGEGSYLIQLPEVVEQENCTYALSKEPGTIGSCARVGFLINEDTVNENIAMETYINSTNYNTSYKSLRGIYQEQGVLPNTDRDYSFMIYEPNGTSHSGKGISYIQTKNGLVMDVCEDGSYVVTTPIAYENGRRVLKDIKDILQVQKKNIWTASQGDVNESTLEQMFQAFLVGKNTSGWTNEQYMTNFYGKYMQKQYIQYITPAAFFSETWSLYYSGDLTKTSAEQVNTLPVSNAVPSARLVTLERNVPQRIRMYVWLEGQDVDCSSSTALEYFTLGI